MAEETAMLTLPCTLPVVSDFTPINRPKGSISPANGAGSKSRHGRKLRCRVQNRALDELIINPENGNSQLSSEPAIPKRPRTTQTLGRSGKNDISKDLQRTKPVFEISTSIPGQKPCTDPDTVSLPCGDNGLELSASRNQPLREDYGGTSNTLLPCTGDNRELSLKSRHFSLNKMYQAEYIPKTVGESDNLIFSQTYQKPSDDRIPVGSVRFDDDGFNESLRSANYGEHQCSISDRASLPWHSHSAQDFEPPPSAQPPRMDFEEPWELATVRFNKISPSCAVYEDQGSFDADDVAWSDVNSFLASEADPEQVGPGAENKVIDDKSLEDFEEWPDDVSMPDAVTIYDEEVQQNPKAATQNDGINISQATAAFNPVSGNINTVTRSRQDLSHGSENDFDDSDFESSLFDLNSPTTAHRPSAPHTSPKPSSSPKLQWLPPKTFTPAKSPSRVPVIQSNVLHIVPRNATGTHLPFVRPPFPKPIRDRSPILGLANTTVLRTCFRIGEALNAAALASRSKIDAIVELYARVIASSREANGGFKQSFQFADLFTDNAPYLSGTSSVWKGVDLWDQDSQVFLGKAGRGKMCRVVGRIKKGKGRRGGCGMTVLSIWEVDWEDVGIAKGVVCS